MTAAEQFMAKGMADGLAKGMADGLAKGRVETLRMAIEKALVVRKVVFTDAGRARLAGCSDPVVLESWYEKALIANAESEIFGG